MKPLGEWKVDDVMTSPVKALNRDWTLREAARYMLENNFSGCPVIDDRKIVVGVLTLKDVARYAEWHLAVEEWSEGMEAEKRSAHRGRKTGETAEPTTLADRMTEATVGHVMTKKVSTVAEGTPLKEMMAYLLEGTMHRVFVTTGDGRLVGLVTTIDLVRFFEDKLEMS